ncbi:tRNA (guanosine(46)-N7)-methyltransferase TrmB [Auritidibacter ignavus]|nr:tRNA (guanosine(46)-N7)-methyltransferase TrmB [Auritidibacter ignavus]
MRRPLGGEGFEQCSSEVLPQETFSGSHFIGFALEISRPFSQFRLSEDINRPKLMGMTSSDSSRTSDNAIPEKYHRTPVSFVRRSTKLSPNRQKLWDESLGQWIVDVPRHHTSMSVDPNFVISPSALFGRDAELVIDIGIGHGESTIAGAKAHPERDFLAVEVYTPGLGKLLAAMVDEGLDNIRGIEANAPEVIDAIEGQAQEVWVFFPDPWQKARYHKRRLIQTGFVTKLATVLRPGGTLRLATDWSNYAEQMRAVMDQHPKFTNLYPHRLRGPDSPLTRAKREGTDNNQPVQEAEALDTIGGWAPRFTTRPVTSFERKATEAGRYIFDLCYQRVADH